MPCLLTTIVKFGLVLYADVILFTQKAKRVHAHVSVPLDLIVEALRFPAVCPEHDRHRLTKIVQLATDRQTNE